MNKIDTMRLIWRDVCLPLEKPALLTREEFIAKYLPQYVEPYRPPTGIRLAGSRVIVSTPASIKAQVSKRNNRIDLAYSEYVAYWNEACKQINQTSDISLID